MERRLCIKCNECQKLMDFDYYANKFICKCNNKYGLEDLADKNKIIIINDNQPTFKIDKKLNINFSKDFFVSELKHQFKYKPLAPDCFLSLKKQKNLNVKLNYIPLILYETKCAIFFNDKDEKISLYKISNMIFDEYTNFDNEVLSSLYPIDLHEKTEEQGLITDSLVEEFNMKFDDIINSIQIKVKEKLNYNVKLDTNSNKNFDMIFLNETYQCILLPIYDCNMNYKNKVYHLSMNANTGKVSVKFPIDNIKLFIITILFLVIDIVFFYLSHLLGVIEEFCIGISIGIFIIQLLLIWCMYFLTIGSSVGNRKNKYHIKKISDY
ncbi:MAG: hypothetical protein IJ501_05715 [Bacilli bacterium]|nr:hypothetical protein [Bacilli bacterium]